MKKSPPLHKSLGYAYNGLRYTLFSQRNIVIHVICAIAALLTGVYFGLERWEWAILVFSIILVFVTETINTAVEISIDLITKKRKFRAMLGKDIAAGAVLLTAINALVVAYLLFYHRFVNLISGG